MHHDLLRPISTLLLSMTLAATLAAQVEVPSAGEPANPVSRQRVEEVIRFLASDALAGRDTPSKGLETAAVYIAKAFAKAGLQPGGDQGSYFHSYRLPGTETDTAAVELSLQMVGAKTSVRLRGGEDVRLYRGVGTTAYEREATGVQVMGEAEASRRLRRSQPRKPVLILVDPAASALWAASVGQRRAVKSRRRLSRAPLLLVRAAAMPKGEIEHAALRIPAAVAVELSLKNVVGVRPGGRLAEEYVLFSSHYDHIGVGLPVDGDGIYNGADDDATGTTAVITLAETFAKARPEHARSLMFICFSGEEKGLVGSKAFAADPTVELQKIAVNLNLEMLGRPDQIKPRCAWVTGREYSEFESVAKIGFARAGIECVVFPQAKMLFRASDNASLARKGVVAHSISAGSLHRDYHRPGDQVGKLDLGHMHAVIHGIYEAGLVFANREQRLAYNKLGRRVLRLDRKKGR